MSKDIIIRACKSLVQKGLLAMESLAYSTYDFHALDPKHLYRRDNHKTEETQQEEVTQNEPTLTQNAPTLLYNNNKGNNNNSCSSCYKDAPDGAQPQQDFFVKEGNNTALRFVKEGNNMPAEALRQPQQQEDFLKKEQETRTKE